MLKYEFKDRK
jgi:hypothetical protein